MIAVDSQMTDTLRELADVVFPAEAYPEKEGTLVHPDGRLQRLRPGDRPPARRERQPGTGVRPLWQVIADVARAARLTTGDFRTGAQVSRRLFEAVPFYAGITLEEIGGRGVRWVERDEFVSPAWEAGEARGPGRRRPPPATASCASAPTARCGRPRRSTSRRCCTSSAPARSPSSRRSTPSALGIDEGDRVEVGNGTPRPRAGVKLREAIPAGSVFLAEGTREDNANVLTARSSRCTASAPAAEPARRRADRARRRGPSEMPPSAPLPIPPREVT